MNNSVLVPDGHTGHRKKGRTEEDEMDGSVEPRGPRTGPSKGGVEKWSRDSKCLSKKRNCEVVGDVGSGMNKRGVGRSLSTECV